MLVQITHEQTKAFPSYNSIHIIVCDSKKQLNACRRACVYGHIAVYPADPHDLPEAIYNEAYANEGPRTVSWDRLANFEKNHIPLLKSSSLLKNQFGGPSAGGGPAAFGGPAASSSSASGAATMKHLVSLLAGAVRGMGGNAGIRLLPSNAPAAQPSGFHALTWNGGESPEDPHTPPNRSSSPLTLAPVGRQFLQQPGTASVGAHAFLQTDHGDATAGASHFLPTEAALRPELADVPGAGSAAAAHGIDAATYEEVAFAAFTDRKRKAADCKAAARKRPAAAPPGVDDDLPMLQWTADDRKRDRRTYQSKAYHSTLQLAKGMGKNVAYAKAAAQAAYKEAGTIWDKRMKK